MPSETKVFTLYWRPLRKHLLFLLANVLPEDTAVNIITYLYYYNGGGVAAGDIDGDGLLDLYFTSNLGSNRLYRNLGLVQEAEQRVGNCGG